MDAITSAIIAGAFVVTAFTIAWTFAPRGFRTVVANVASVVMMLAIPVVGYLEGINWGNVIDSKTAFFLVIGLNIMGIILRRMTKGPIGKA